MLCHGGELRQQALLRCQAQRKHAAQVILRIGQLRGWNRKGPQLVQFVENLCQRCGHNVVAYCRGHREKAVLAKRSEEHTSELQSHSDLVCRLLLEKKKRKSRRDSE